ncbi:MAG: cation-translocating P-type ATPase [Candidatus Promineifilaceae bacterium]
MTATVEDRPAAAAGPAWYQMSAADVVERLGSHLERGLDSAEASARIEQYGPNELVERAGRSPWSILWEQLTGFLTLLLIAAAGISIFLGDLIDAIAILLIVVLNAALGFSQEHRAEQAMAALKRLAVPSVRVRRGGRIVELTARELAPGDVVILETGNAVPADGRVLESVNLRVTEAALTGESEPVDKEEQLVFESERALGDRRNMAYMGTVVSYGHGEMIVTDTGMATELGRIADLIQSVGEEQTPLQRRLDRLGKQLAAAAIAIVAVIFVIGYLRGADIEEMFLTAVSLAVAAVPEAMTAVVTIALSLGAQRMLRRRALIRRLPAVETLGSVSVICSDKTGTLTLNQMTVTALDVANFRIVLQQSERGGDFDVVPQNGEAPEGALRPTMDLLLIGGALANDAILERDDDGEGYVAIGDPTEGALILSAAEFGLLKGALDASFPRIAELPFDSVRKRMTTVHRVPQSNDDIPADLMHVWQRRPISDPPPFVAFTKGAVDSLLDISKEVWVNGEAVPLDAEWRERVIASNAELAGRGMRVLGVGLRTLEAKPAAEEMEEVEGELTLIGLFGMIDPPRPEVTEAVAICSQAGIRPVMITGDHPLTARHIAQQVGIGDGETFMTGQELDRLSDEQLKEAADKIAVFARVSPEHKLKLVQAYQEQARIVAMTGDGVNDAPALKKADIGVAMGITGTDVAKEAADMVLLDDNFATIVAAVEEGRIIYDNIRKFIKYLLSCNASEIMVMLVGPLLGMPIPLLPLQILWMNLVTDGLPALALSIEPAEESVMKRPPYSSTESVFGRGAMRFILSLGAVMSAIAIAVGFGFFSAGREDWQTVLFTTLIFAQLALALGVRTEETALHKVFFTNRPMLGAVALTILLQLAVVYLPFMQAIFETDPLPAGDLALTFGAGLLVLLVVELYKWRLRS